MRRGTCSIKLKLFRSALGMDKIMRDPAAQVAHGRKTLQMCGSKIILALDLKGFMLVLGGPVSLGTYMVSTAFDLKGFILVLGNIIRPCRQI